MKRNHVERLLVVILVVIAIGIVIHAPLTVWLGSVWPKYAEQIKAWKEILMAVALVLLIVVAVQRKKLSTLLRDRLIQISLVYAGLHFVLVGVFDSKLNQVGAGLLIDLRYVLYFVLVYATLKLLPQHRQLFVRAFAAGAVIVLGFSLLQQFVLPRDILSNIGYNKSTISPYLLVDQNPTYARINSTLRGPNPLGAYAVIVLGILAAIASRSRLERRQWWLLGLFALASGLALGASYSRSALIGAAIALTVVVLGATSGKIRQRVGWSVAVILLVLAGSLYGLRDTSFVQNIMLHSNPTTGAIVKSDSGHLSSVVDGLKIVAKEPLGAGIGSTGSASLSGNDPLVVENQYLFVAHEVGWVGLGLFIWLIVEIMVRLWAGRRSVLALGVFAGGCGLLVIGLLLPVWADDTVSIVWWGLAAVAIAGGAHARKSH